MNYTGGVLLTCYIDYLRLVAFVKSSTYQNIWWPWVKTPVPYPKTDGLWTWVNYSISLTWIVWLFGDNSPYQRWFQASGEQGSVVMKFTQMDVYSPNMALVGGFDHLEKYESQWEGLSHILWKIKNLWTTNQWQYCNRFNHPSLIDWTPFEMISRYNGEVGCCFCY